VAVTGVTLDTISWDKLEGGDPTAETSNYLPGGMEPSIELGGLPKRSDLVVHRIWSDTLVAVYKQLDNGVGRLPGAVTYTVLDANRNPLPGSTISYTGILKAVARPGYDSSTSTEALLSLTFGLNGSIT
jgi:hypothetical protein